MLYLAISWCYDSKGTPWMRSVLGLTAGGPESKTKKWHSESYIYVPMGGGVTGLGLSLEYNS